MTEEKEEKTSKPIKGGFWQTFFKILGILILLIIIIIGVTAYQGYRLYMVVQEEKGTIEQISIGEPIRGDCSKITDLEVSIDKITREAKTACWNPIIKIAIDKIEQIAVKCKDIPTLKSSSDIWISPAKLVCTKAGVGNFSNS